MQPWHKQYVILLNIVVLVCTLGTASAWQWSQRLYIDGVRLYPDGQVIFHTTAVLANSSGCPHPQWVEFGPNLPTYREFYAMVLQAKTTQQPVSVLWDGCPGHMNGVGLVLEP